MSISNPFRAFSGAEHDAYEGATNFPDGSGPLITEGIFDGKLCDVILAGHGVEIVWEGGRLWKNWLDWGSHPQSAFEALGRAVCLFSHGDNATAMMNAGFKKG